MIACCSIPCVNFFIAPVAVILLIIFMNNAIDCVNAAVNATPSTPVPDDNPYA